MFFYFLPVLISVGRPSHFIAFVGRLNIPAGTLRTLAGSCSEDIAGVEVSVTAYLGLWRHSRMVSLVVLACGTLRIVA